MKILKKKHNRSKKTKSSIGKKIVIGGFTALLAIGGFAQHQERGFEKSEMTPEQIAELQTKKMTLGLELTETQQEKVFNLNQEQAIKRRAKRKEMKALREKGEKPTGKSLFERKNARLDEQIAHQKEMKSILSDTQYETWKKSRKHRANKIKTMRKYKKMKQRAKGKKSQERKGQK